MENLNGIMFYMVAILVITTGTIVVFSKKIMNAILSALACFTGFGLLFFTLNAPFNGVIQISIYGIALSILFTISIMLTNYKNENKQKIKFSVAMLLACIGIAMITCSIITFINESTKFDTSLYTYFHSSHLLTSFDNIKQLSIELLTNNLYAFELLGLYILIVLVGIAVLITFKGESQ